MLRNRPPDQALGFSVWLSLIALIIVNAACSRHVLTRDEAGRILTASNAFRSTSYFRVTRTEQAAMDPRGCFQFQNKPGWLQLTDLGWATVEIKTTSEPTAFSYAWYGCTLQLTSEGQRQASQWRPWNGPLDTSGWEVPLAASQFVDVTGISQANGGETAQVQYSYRWTPTDFAKMLGRMPDGNLKGGAALFRHYDDGWRLQDFGFGAVAEPQFSEVPPGPPPAGQAEWAAYMTNEHVSTTVTFNLSSDGGGTWQTFSLAPRTMGTYQHMNRFKAITNFPDGHTQTAEYPLPTHGLKYYSIICQGENYCAWDLGGDDEFVALARANK